jgi:uncharacterized protein GlcG (DUF336 family)
MTVSRKSAPVLAITAASLLLASCGGDGNSPSPAATPTPSPSPTALYAVPAQEALTVAEVQTIVAQAVAEANARGKPAVVAVADRVGNVLAVFRMNGAPGLAHISDAPNGQNVDIQGLDVPAEAAAIAKAITGAYLSSGGNAFSSRTASQIVQQHFPPAPGVTAGLESGPLFGVQFSQLPCSDLNTRFTGTGTPAAFIGPKRSPLGLAADPGGFPLYKNGVLVGGVGVLADGQYGFDPDTRDVDADDDEFVALAGTVGFEAVEGIRANRISVDGTLLRYSDATAAGLRSSPAGAPGFATINGAVGVLVQVRGYSSASVTAGTPYGGELSGLRKATTSEFAGLDAFVLTDGSGANRFPIRAGTDGGTVAQPLTAAESRALLEEAFTAMSRARAQIRQPLDSRAQVTISLVDTFGAVLGIVRSPDAPIFGADVSLQKARSVSFFSNAAAAQQLLANPSADVQSLVDRARTFFGDPNILTGSTAFSNRAIGNVSRPYFPDGELGRGPGPFSRPIEQFNPFSTGLQSALILANLGEHLAFVTGTSGTDTPQRCTMTADVAAGQNRLQNGLQIFPGAVPIYRGTQLVGGLGVSGDGIDQDDMISFLGLANAARRVGGIGHAPAERRSDRIIIQVSGREVRLRYVNCPFAPLLDTPDQNVCQGI